MNLIKGKGGALKFSFIILSIIAVFAVIYSAGVVFGGDSQASISTDKLDYEPGETVLISGSGFLASTPLTVSVTRPTEPDPTIDTCSADSCDSRFIDGLLTSDEEGAFSDYQYDLDGDVGEYNIEVSDGVNTAERSFSDGYWVYTACNSDLDCIEGCGDFANMGNPDGLWDDYFYGGGTCYTSGPWEGWCYNVAHVEKDSPDCQQCIPDCSGKQCGDDGCGGSCGTCEPDESCINYQCIPNCGNGILDEGEDCDDGNLNGKTCSDFNDFNYGDLSCSETCEFDTSLCGYDDDCPVVEVLIPPATPNVTWYTGTIDVKAAVSDYESGVKKARVIFHDDSPLTWKEGFFDMIYNSGEGRWEYSWDTSSIECSVVYADVAGEDEAGNGVENECKDTNRFGVDNAPPVTEKTVGTPSVDKEDDDNYYVKTTTQFTLTADDCGSGVDHIHYEIWWDSDDNGNVDTKVTDETIYDDEVSFYFEEESIHEIRWYAVDKLENTENEHVQKHAVDDTAPEITKEVGDPQVECDSEDPNNCDYYITQQTPITLTCTDKQPHPVDQVSLYYRYRYADDCEDLDEAEWTNWIDPVEAEVEKTIYFQEDSCHELEYYCEDALGNSAGTSEEPFQEVDVVDTQAPVTEKIIGDPKYIGPEGCGEGCQPDCKVYIDGVTTIELTCEDQGPHPVSGEQIYYRYRVDANPFPQDWTLYSGPFSFPEESVHELEWYCVDALGNMEINTQYPICNEQCELGFNVNCETDYVDHTPPETTKTYGDPLFTDGTMGFDLETITDASNRLVALQNTDGGWNWIVTDATIPGESTSANIVGVTAMGLLDAYKLTGNSDYLDSAEEAGDYLVDRFFDGVDVDTSNRINGFDIVFLYELGGISTAYDYTGAANDLLNNVLYETSYFSDSGGEYGDACGTDGCTAQELFNGVEYRRSSLGIEIALWDLFRWVEAAELGGETTWANELRTLMDAEYSTLDDTNDYYIIGLSGLVLATGNTNAENDLLLKQSTDGSWNGWIQDTAYALMALNKAGHYSEATDAAVYLVDHFGYGSSIDGWLNKLLEDDTEYSEVTSEALQALSAIGSIEGVHWINSDTKITLKATDDSDYEECESGVDKTYYRITLLENDGACLSDSVCQQQEGTGDFSLYEGPFTIGEESCHLIEYYSVDHVNKTETVKKQCVFVDNTAPEGDKVIGEPKLLCEDGEEKCGPEGEWSAYYVTTSTPITLSCVDQGDHPVDNEKVCFKISWHDTEYNENDFSYITSQYGEPNNDGYVCVDVDEQNDFTFYFLEDSLHNIEWYCEDALGNKGEEEIEWDNVDTEGPEIIVLNPTPFEREIERCTQSIVVEVIDEKSGVDEESVYAQLYYEDGETPVPGSDYNITLTKTEYGTYEGLMNKELPPGDYVLKVFAKDKLGNQGIGEIDETLKETVFVEYIYPASCNIDPLTGGSCDFTFHVCMRGSNTVEFWLNKLGDIITPGMMNAMISDPDHEGNEAFVGLKHLAGYGEGYNNKEDCENSGFYWDDHEEKCYSRKNGGELQLSCEEINGKEQFTLHLDVPEDVASQLGLGKHNLEYWIESGLDTEDCVIPYCGDGICNAAETCSTCEEDCGECSPVCGNGILETGEGCDDGNIEDGDGCSSLCVSEYCGDEIVNGDEECEIDEDCPSQDYICTSCVCNFPT